jgi:hypothetical protein
LAKEWRQIKMRKTNYPRIWVNTSGISEEEREKKKKRLERARFCKHVWKLGSNSKQFPNFGNIMVLSLNSK